MTRSPIHTPQVKIARGRWMLELLARATLVTTLVVAGSFCVPRTARAQQSNHEAEQARLFRLGAEAFTKHKWPEAIDAFRLGLLYGEAPILVYNLGRAFEESGDLESAILQFKQYATMDGIRTNDRAEARVRIDRLTEGLATRPGEVALVPVPEGVRVYLDGEEVELAKDGVISARPGNRHLRVAGNGIETFETTLSVTPMKRLVVSIRPTMSLGTLRVESSVAGSRVLVDGRIVSESGEVVLTLAGQHEIVVEAPGYGRFQERVDVAGGRELRVRAELRAAASPPAAPPMIASGANGRPLRTAAWATMSTGLALLGAGIGCNVATTQIRNEVNGLRDENGVISRADMTMLDAAERSDKANTLATVSIVTYSIGAAATIAAIILFALPDDEGDEKALVWPSPRPLTGGAMLMVEGGF